ncbi:MAG: methionine gamma-lyase [Gammaproteobacteria bacterium]|jgi:methionine-gamma-lyase|nr:methionine gamma-lyase [Gammaproteobacteria bacterium]MBT3723926.1 methionine gamma-lyase [Gammaproteobacteria bacterium]MBT4076994.1 methionine gamma-lyase [Gammaproteobacteria bacterium]MBT4193803.1 methionine gamma-lyase [Gammaproteobacteria bacterium]MBT4449842.1 methionine gamma-lyase [Gammaproteobacteria bacterium]
MTKLKYSSSGFSTRAIHTGHDPQQHHGALNPPVYLNSTYAFESTAQGQKRFLGEEPGYVYSRVGNPTETVLEQKLADLEGGEAALAVASGMGAITSLIWSFVEPGDEIIADKTLYGCTFAFFTEGISKFNIKITFIDLTQPEELEKVISSKTRFVFFETPANPNMRLIDISVISAIAHDNGARVIVDNTYCTPYLQRPLEMGADFVVHSLTKYLSGHGDIIAGAIIGPLEDIQKIHFYGVKDMTGAVISPFDAFLTIRGLKTLEIRMDRHCQSAMKIAEVIENHPAVKQVFYPGLASHPQHQLAKEQMNDFGGMIAFELVKGFDAGVIFMDNVQLAMRAVSLGDAETLVQHPASMTHVTYPPEERLKHGISEGLVRISVGLETLSDLMTDIKQALDKAI